MAITVPIVNSVVLPTFCTLAFNRGTIVLSGLPIKAIAEDAIDLLITLAIAQST
ncbi:alkanesulfonate monooxygenase [Clostridium botulinum]|nr:alkanesulfonate monooxygenase [Clostridium botulinum]NFQ89116.1 alkanesulfonate monooxygenase [Clostridium botulinum]NFU73914.1 alkanesulfonate monooxygenase [Clostridium botulinum]